MYDLLPDVEGAMRNPWLETMIDGRGARAFKKVWMKKYIFKKLATPFGIKRRQSQKVYVHVTILI